MAYIDGMKKLNQRLYKLAEGKAVADAMGKCLALVEGESKENCPVQTGELRRSITSRMKQEPTLIQGEVFSDKEYAIYTHQGTGIYAENGDGRDTPWSYQDADGNWHTTLGQHPNPFMERALDENKEKCLQYIKDSIRREIQND